MPDKRGIITDVDWLNKCLKILLYHTECELENRKWRLRDTARELGVSVGFISESLLIAKMHVTLELRQCNSRDEALRKCRGK